MFQVTCPTFIEAMSQKDHRRDGALGKHRALERAAVQVRFSESSRSVPTTQNSTAQSDAIRGKEREKEK